MAKLMNIDNARSYADERNLVKAIQAKGMGNHKYLVVCNTWGRFTAIFPTGWNPDLDICHMAHVGFMVVG